MLTFALWIQKFPQFATVPEDVWAESQIEASIEMGENVNRWSGQATYDIAQGYLIAHLSSLAERWEAGDHSPAQALRSKEVDDVVVEFAVSREMQNNLDPYVSTSYGQQYIKWRRMLFAGPRIV